MPRHINNFPEVSREWLAAHFAHMEDELRSFLEAEAEKSA